MLILEPACEDVRIASMEIADVTEDVRAIGLGSLCERMGIEIQAAELSENGWTTVRATMRVGGNTQPYGLLHGGASAVLAESLGSIAAGVTAYHLLGDGFYVVGLDLNCTHHKSVRDGLVTGTARILTAGKTIIMTEIVVSNQGGIRVSTSRLTCLVRRLP